MERTHRQLRAWLTDRLRGDNADSLTLVDRRTTGQIAAVALGADAAMGLAGKRRTDADRLNASLFDRIDIELVDDVATSDKHVTCDRMHDVFERGPAENTLTERRNDLAGIDDRLHGEAGRRTAIHRDDDAILRDVNKTACQVTGVSRLQGGVGETLTGTVGRVEVLVHGQAFLEVRNDRRFDDFARRLGHQTAHTAQLTHLVRRTTGARVRHHVDRVHLLLAASDRIELDRLDACHHFVGDLLGALAPSVDDLVVLLALGDQAVIVLLLVFRRQASVSATSFALVSGMTMSSLPKEMPARQAWLKPSCMMRSQKMTVSF